MSRIVSIHSFRGGTGKSNTTANLATVLAMEGKMVGVVDTDIQSPGIHVLFGLGETDVGHSLNDYLWGECEIIEAAHDVTKNVGADIAGTIYLIPSSLKAGEIARVLRDGYDEGLLNDGFYDLIHELNLDVLIIDTHPGLNEETLLSIAISDVLVIILRPDEQDFLGTSVTVEVARKLDVPKLSLLVNKVPQVFLSNIKSSVEQTYHEEVVAVLPHSDEMMTLAGQGVFVARFPEHNITTEIKKVAAKIME